VLRSQAAPSGASGELVFLMRLVRWKLCVRLQLVILTSVSGARDMASEPSHHGHTLNDLERYTEETSHLDLFPRRDRRGGLRLSFGSRLEPKFRESPVNPQQLTP
jgi:hypothetical protein